jgi:predicted glycoside hydrolase/deacetylase ChbG (UPF0249 family)
LNPRKQLVVNADDFGFTPDVNSGIVEAHRNGILTATTMMANGDAFDDALRRARETPSLDIGCHLALIGGRSLVSGKPFPPAPRDLAIALMLGRVRVYDELAAQIRKILAAGIRPTHIDTHKHTHLAPSVLDAVARLAKEFEIPWVRSPFDFPLHGLRATVPRGKQLTSNALSLMRGRFKRVLALNGLRSTDNFAGFQITGRFDAALLTKLFALLPGGSTELMVHPGHYGPALDAAPTRLKQSRQDELVALCAPEVRAALEKHGIELVNYRSLATT